MKPKKSLGQNFLIDKNKILEIISNLKINNELVIEVGPGKGALTKYLQEKCQELLLVEIDQDMINYLDKQEYIQKQNVKLINKDILELDLKNYITKDKSVIFVSNLPYYIATQIIFKVIKEKQITTIGVMLQKELAERIISKHNNKSYGRITVALGTYFELEKKIIVNKENFYPKPKVDSLFLVLKKKEEFLTQDVDEEYLLFIKKCFAKKRKTLLNSLKHEDFKDINAIKSFLNTNKLSENIRAEQLSIEQFYDLWNFINK